MNRKVIAKLLGLAENAPDEDFEAAIIASLEQAKRLESVLGKAGDEAHGVLLAWKKTVDDAPGIKTELDALKKTTAEQELNTIVADGKAAKKLTPALEKQIREGVASGDMTLKGAKAFVAALPEIKALVAAGDGATPPAAPIASDDEEPKHNGKAFAELTGTELKALKSSNPELYAAMVAYSKRKVRGGR